MNLRKKLRHKPKMSTLRRRKVAEMLLDLVNFQHNRGWELIRSNELDAAVRLQGETDKTLFVLQIYAKKSPGILAQ